MNKSVYSLRLQITKRLLKLDPSANTDGDGETFANIQYEWKFELQNLQQLGPAEISTLVTWVVNSYLRPQEEKLKHSLTCRCVSLQTASGNRQPSPFLFPSLCPPCVPGQTPPPLQHLLRTRSPFSNIFSLLAEKGPTGFWSQRDAF